MSEPETLIIDNPSGRGQSAVGLVVDPVPLCGYGTARLIDDIAGPVGEPVPVFGCACAAQAGERVPLHRCSAAADWHTALPGDYPDDAYPADAEGHR